MSKKTVVILPETQRILERMGDQIKTARLRRNLATELVAERAGISRATLWSVEKGSPTVAIGIYAAVLHALGGMDKDLELVGAVMEYANYRAKANITPAYYDITLKGKVSRDVESVEMLDLILDNRVVDLGDTQFCASVRDGFFTAMYRSNNRDLTSVLQKNEKSLQKEIDDMIAGMTEAKE